jgi:DNA polymerase-3 subunit alpha
VKPDFFDQLRRILTPYRSPCSDNGTPVAICYQRADAEARLRFGEEWRVEPCDDLLHRLKEDLAVDDVRLRYRDVGVA